MESLKRKQPNKDVAGRWQNRSMVYSPTKVGRGCDQADLQRGAAELAGQLLFGMIQSWKQPYKDFHRFLIHIMLIYDLSGSSKCKSNGSFQGNHNLQVCRSVIENVTHSHDDYGQLRKVRQYHQDSDIWQILSIDGCHSLEDIEREHVGADPMHPMAGMTSVWPFLVYALFPCFLTTAQLPGKEQTEMWREELWAWGKKLTAQGGPRGSRHRPEQPEGGSSCGVCYVTPCVQGRAGELEQQRRKQKTHSHWPTSIWPQCPPY